MPWRFPPDSLPSDSPPKLLSPRPSSVCREVASLPSAARGFATTSQWLSRARARSQSPWRHRALPADSRRDETGGFGLPRCHASPASKLVAAHVPLAVAAPVADHRSSLLVVPPPSPSLRRFRRRATRRNARVVSDETRELGEQLVVDGARLRSHVLGGLDDFGRRIGRGFDGLNDGR